MIGLYGEKEFILRDGPKCYNFLSEEYLFGKDHEDEELSKLTVRTFQRDCGLMFHIPQLNIDVTIGVSGYPKMTKAFIQKRIKESTIDPDYFEIVVDDFVYFVETARKQADSEGWRWVIEEDRSYAGDIA